MAKYLKKFETHTEYLAFTQTSDFIKPNVSYCEDQNEVHYNPWVDTRIVAKFNVTNTSSPTNITGYNNYAPIVTTDYFSEIEIDGVVQPSVVRSYTFDTLGEHTVKYTLVDETTIDYSAFYGCSNLTNVTIPNSVTTIDTSAFYRCSGLTSVTIPSGVTTIDNSAFYGCSNLTSIAVDSNNMVYDSRNNCNAIIETATNMLIKGCNTTIIPNSVTAIGRIAFNMCNSLSSITIPDSVTSIGDSAFQDCSSLTSITIPDNVTTIGEQSFQNCQNLTNVTIGNSVISIGIYAFGYCTSLSSVTVEATTPPTLGSDAFNNNASGRKIFVPSESVEAYKAASGWSTYAADIEAIPTT